MIHEPPSLQLTVDTASATCSEEQAKRDHVSEDLA
jgi:hypothetical protein